MCRCASGLDWTGLGVFLGASVLCCCADIILGFLLFNPRKHEHENGSTSRSSRSRTPALSELHCRAFPVSYLVSQSQANKILRASDFPHTTDRWSANAWPTYLAVGKLHDAEEVISCAMLAALTPVKSFLTQQCLQLQQSSLNAPTDHTPESYRNRGRSIFPPLAPVADYHCIIVDLIPPSALRLVA